MWKFSTGPTEAQPNSGPFVQNDKRSLFTLHSLAEAYGRRPSEIIGLTDEWAAYQFDAAALTLGRIVKTAAINGDDLNTLFNGHPSQPDPGRFRSPAPFVTRRMAIPESGVW